MDHFTPILKARAARLIIVCMLLLGAAAWAAGTASISPASFNRGQPITITYNATGGPLAGVSGLRLHYGFNRWSSVVNTDPALTAQGTNVWTYTFTMPADKTQLDFVVRNAAASVYDNNNGSDWHFTIDLGLYPLGSHVVPAAQGGGVVFRVWAPNATSVSVRGQFNSFDLSEPMTLNGATGVWQRWVNTAAAGQQYKYFLNGTTWRKDPRARRVANSNGNSIIYDAQAFNWGNDRLPAPALRDLVIYEMHVGSWEDGSDNVAPGTFSDAITRLDALRELGINAVELLPVTEYAGEISGGYNPTDPYAVETAYGSADGLKHFVRACHQRGIAVLLDVLHNHYGPGGDLDLYGFDGGGGAQGVYFYDAPAALANTPFGPRPDYASTPVRDFIRENTRMWLDEYHIDGFRWDFTKGIRGTVDSNYNITAPIAEGISLLRDNNDLTHAYGRISVAEDLANEPLMVAPTSQASGYGFDAQWDVDYLYGVVNQLKLADGSRNMTTLAGKIAGDLTRVQYLESHDEVWKLNAKDRLPTRLDATTPTGYRARKLGGLAAGMLFSSGGMPLMFMGQEWGETARWDEFVGLDWSRATTPPYSNTRAMYRDLIHLRRNLSGATRGLTGDATQVYLTLQAQQVLAWRRTIAGGKPGDDVVILANFSAANYPLFSIGFPSAGTWYEQFNSDSKAYGSDFSATGVGQVVTTTNMPQHGFNQRGNVAIGPYSVVILSQARPQSAAAQDWAAYEN